MTTPMAIAVFFTIWWVVLFAVLPFGVRSQRDSGEVVHGTDPGAPIRPRLVVKALWTTLITIVIFAGVYVLANNYG